MTKPYVYVTRPVQDSGVALLKTQCEVQIGTSEELEKEKFHQFNRIFLLGSLLISFVVPSFVILVTEQVKKQ